MLETKNCISPCGELALEEAMDLSSDYAKITLKFSQLSMIRVETKKLHSL
jgi:hypothetical protein